MPNGKQHAVLGSFAGAALAATKAKKEQSASMWLEVAGGGIGGWFGGKLPDRLEPATSPNHRAVFHSLLALAGIGVIHYYGLDAVQSRLRAEAAVCEQALAGEHDPLRRMWLWAQIAFYRTLSGAAAGICCGYYSHVGSDALTPRSIPFA